MDKESALAAFQNRLSTFDIATVRGRIGNYASLMKSLTDTTRRLQLQFRFHFNFIRELL
jgi:hypothetical protein